MCVNVKETKELVELAREKKLFLMEGVWSRCMPAYRALKYVNLLQKRNTGTVSSDQNDFLDSDLYFFEFH
jgi:predicted dehydrogenase